MPRIAVLSDLHVDEGVSDSNESWLSTSSHDDDPKNPFFALQKLIEDESISADLLLCCGDMANKANAAGQKYAWKKINELSVQLNAELCIGTAGNHDLDSRLSATDFDPKGNLQELRPDFPGISLDFCNRYWARNFALHAPANDAFNLLNINSCAFHGYGTNDPEYLHGRISQATLNAISLELSRLDLSKINIAFFHHHPTKSDSIVEDDYSEMSGGNRLIDLLGKGASGHWLCIHGHKHQSQINYAAGGSTSPIVFASGSFSSKRLAPSARHNEFYIIDVHPYAQDRNLPLCGVVRSWVWNAGSNWRAADSSCGIPDGSGFGSRIAPETVLSQVVGFVNTQSNPYVDWEDLTSAVPELKFMLPKDRKELTRLLEATDRVTVLCDTVGRIQQLGVTT